MYTFFVALIVAGSTSSFLADFFLNKKKTFLFTFIIISLLKIFFCYFKSFVGFTDDQPKWRSALPHVNMLVCMARSTLRITSIIFQKDVVRSDAYFVCRLFHKQ